MRPEPSAERGGAKGRARGESPAESTGFLDRFRALFEGPYGRPITLGAGVAVAGTLGALTHWVVFEYDLFFMVRAGFETLTQGTIQKVDTWSHTIAGRPWYNFQWLTTAIYYLVSLIAPNYEAFSTMRALFAGGWALAQWLLILRAARGGHRAALIAFALVPYIYTVCSFRFQMRADLIAANINAWLLLVWTSAWPERKKRLAGLALVLLWANIHAGTAPMGILLHLAATFFSDDLAARGKLRERFAWLAATIAAWFMTPIGVNIVSVIMGNVLEYDYEFTRNPDLQPFRFHLLQYRHGGYSISLWFVFTCAVAWAYYSLWKTPEALPPLYRKRGFAIAVGGALTLLSLQKIRGLHYHVAFSAPILAAALARLIDTGKIAYARTAIGSAVVFGFIAFVALPDQIRYVNRPIGKGVFEKELPVHAAAFVRRVKPAGKLLNTPAFGGYLIHELPEYPVSIDSRDFPFIPFLREQGYAMRDPNLYPVFLKKYGINLVFEYLPSTNFSPERGFVDGLAPYYPPSDWAPVFFDNAAIVFLRRIPENRAILEKHEYRFVKRGLPANYGAVMEGISESFRISYEAEIDRCLADVATNVYCLMGKAAFLKKRKLEAEALVLLERAYAKDWRNPELELQLASTYETLGRFRDAKKHEKLFERLTR